MPIVNYATIQPPFTLQFDQMSKNDLRDYFRWFQEIMPERIAQLKRAVIASPGFEDWSGDFTPSSLDKLGEWFAANVETRNRTPEELREIRDKLAFPVEISGQELTNRSYSIAIDIGMYLSQVFLRNHPPLNWDQPFGSKKFIDYGQPVLVGFGLAPFNPVRMMVTQARGLVDKTRKPSELREIYEIWAKKIR